MQLEPGELAKTIDHTLLAADARRAQIDRLCQEARTHGFYSVCVNSAQVPHAAAQLAGSAVKVCAVVGFPLGAGLSAAKAFEAEQAIAAGAGEIDMVLNLGWLKDGLLEEVSADIAAVQALGEAGGRPEDVIRTRSYLVDAADAEAVGAAHQQVFSGIRPASTMVVVGGLLDSRWKIEIEMEAVLSPLEVTDVPT